jgi:tubulin delta
VARAVLVDMEPKVVDSALAATERLTWRYDAAAAHCQQSGSGNNWAHGFFVHGPRSAEAIGELVRHEAEAAGRVDALLLLHSLAGGTGSGLGSFVTQMLRDEFPAAVLVNVAVSPFSSGEVTVQHLNAALTLAATAQLSDGAVLVENDVIGAVCARLFGVPRPSFDHLNTVIAAHLAAALLPARPIEPAARGDTCAWRLSDSVAHLFAHPAFRLSTLRLVPQTAAAARAFDVLSWHSLLRRLHLMAITDSASEEGATAARARVRGQVPEVAAAAAAAERRDGDDEEEEEQKRPRGPQHSRAVASLLTLRGASPVSAEDVRAFGASEFHVDWSSPAVAVLHNPRSFQKHERMCTLWSVSQSAQRVVERSLRHGWRLFSLGAFTHHYERHGLSREEFATRFEALEQVNASYASLSKA